MKYLFILNIYLIGICSQLLQGYVFVLCVCVKWKYYIGFFNSLCEICAHIIILLVSDSILARQSSDVQFFQRYHVIGKKGV